MIMKLSKKILAGVVGMAMVMMTSVSALAVAPGYSDYGTSDTKDVVKGEAVGALTAPNTGVTVDIPADVLPDHVEKVSMEIAAVDKEEVKAALANAEKKGFSNVDVLNIVLRDQNGNPISQLNGKVSVTVPASNNQNAVIYIADDDSITDMNAVLKNSYLTFETDHFSYYAAAEKAVNTSGNGNVQTGENNLVTMAVVAVMFVAGAGIVILSMKAKKVRTK